MTDLQVARSFPSIVLGTLPHPTSLRVILSLSESGRSKPAPLQEDKKVGAASLRPYRRTSGVKFVLGGRQHPLQALTPRRFPPPKVPADRTPSFRERAILQNNEKTAVITAVRPIGALARHRAQRGAVKPTLTITRHWSVFPA